MSLLTIPTLGQSADMVQILKRATDNTLNDKTLVCVGPHSGHLHSIPIKKRTVVALIGAQSDTPAPTITFHIVSRTPASNEQLGIAHDGVGSWSTTRLLPPLAFTQDASKRQTTLPKLNRGWYHLDGGRHSMPETTKVYMARRAEESRTESMKGGGSSAFYDDVKLVTYNLYNNSGGWSNARWRLDDPSGWRPVLASGYTVPGEIVSSIPASSS
ncbi:hypothetical protein IW262DRAFT_1299640 [Armillaria fumosa]|nr:hypothetical protein IW262DRAFT_1299640 [Armillaria fumosa]